MPQPLRQMGWSWFLVNRALLYSPIPHFRASSSGCHPLTIELRGKRGNGDQHPGNYKYNSFPGVDAGPLGSCFCTADACAAKHSIFTRNHYPEIQAHFTLPKNWLHVKTAGHVPEVPKIEEPSRIENGFG